MFPVVDYAYTCIPTYPGGQIGFILCSTNPVSSFFLKKQNKNTDYFMQVLFSQPVFFFFQRRHNFELRFINYPKLNVRKCNYAITLQKCIQQLLLYLVSLEKHSSVCLKLMKKKHIKVIPNTLNLVDGSKFFAHYSGELVFLLILATATFPKQFVVSYIL